MKGIGHFNKQYYLPDRQLIYVGYGSYFPIANNLHLKSIRSNSRIQITAYPPNGKLHLDQCYKVYQNIGAMDNTKCPDETTPENPDAKSNLTDETDYSMQSHFNSEVQTNQYSQNSAVIPGLKGEFSDAPENHNTADSSPQTVLGSNVTKQAGLKGEVGLKGEGAFNGASTG